MIAPKTRLMANYLDYLSQQQRLTASNLANLDTPGYRTRRLDFEAALRSALDDPRGEPRTAPRVTGAPGLAVQSDGNDVSLDRELQSLSETAVRFSYALSALRGGIRAVRSAIQEGRGG